MSKRSIAIAAAGVMAICGIGIATSAQADEQISTPVAEAPLDPVTEALGADSPEAVVELQQAQQELTEIGLGDSPEAEHVNQVRSDLGDAVDQLYGDVADDPAARQGQAMWRSCMASSGTPYGSPMDIEASIDSPRVDPDRIDGHLLDEVLANRDACDTRVDDELAVALEGEFPTWIEEHDVTIDQYRDLIEGVSN